MMMIGRPQRFHVLRLRTHNVLMHQTILNGFKYVSALFMVQINLMTLLMMVVVA